MNLRIKIVVFLIVNLVITEIAFSAQFKLCNSPSDKGYTNDAYLHMRESKSMNTYADNIRPKVNRSASLKMTTLVKSRSKPKSKTTKKRYTNKLFKKRSPLLAMNNDKPTSIKEEIDKVTIKATKSVKHTRSLFILMAPYIFYVILSFFTCTLILLFTVYIKRTIHLLIDRNREESKQNNMSIIIAYLFRDDNKRYLPIGLKGLNSNFYKSVIVSQLVELNSAFTGKLSTNCKQLFRDLKLDRLILSKLEVPLWHHKVKNIRILLAMNEKRAIPFIRKYTKSRNARLRFESNIALLRLSDEEDFSFLDNYDKPITEIEQIYLYNVIVRNSIMVPNFSKWLDSRNISLVVFSIKMIRMFHQTYSYEEVIRLVHHKNGDIAIQSIITLGELGIKSSTNDLIDRYLSAGLQMQTAIIRSLKLIQDESTIPFLKDILENQDYQLRFEAAKALFSFSIEGQAILKEKLLSSKDEELLLIIYHVFDPRT